MRNGTQVTLTSSDGKTTSFTPPTGKMGYGEVNISLALAEALMGSGSTQGILQLRASGMGWGQIANSPGFKLGEVVRSAKADSATQLVHCAAGGRTRNQRPLDSASSLPPMVGTGRRAASPLRRK